MSDLRPGWGPAEQVYVRTEDRSVRAHKRGSLRGNGPHLCFSCMRIIYIYIYARLWKLAFDCCFLQLLRVDVIRCAMRLKLRLDIFLAGN